MLDEVEDALCPKRASRLVFKLAFAILLVPAVVTAFYMSRTVVRSVEKTMEAPAGPSGNAQLDLATCQKLEIEIEQLDKQLFALETALADKRKAADSKWIARTRDKEEIAALSAEIRNILGLRAGLVQEHNAIAPVGSAVR